ncbi:hypothetical protein JOB18_019899 [Solea senegalensis]|uniref:Saposin B-type domain-containing protein n=1 Tax=Solea senegalensis TaxID=28829 RepID=A0AAV6RI97_SOLSE|nr:hypothetical protein JOB18_019899 [Solea senegalensis]
MEILIFLVCTCFLLPVQPKETDRQTYCESCLTMAQEIEKVLKQAPDENRQTAVKNLISGGVCKKVSSFKNDHKTNNKLVSSCIQLLDSHYAQFREALVNKEPKNLGIVLCYEESKACVGVKRQSFEVGRVQININI